MRDAGRGIGYTWTMKTPLLLSVALSSALLALAPRADLLPGNFWPNPSFEEGQDLDNPDGTLDQWGRGGSNAGLCVIAANKAVSPTHALAVIDEDVEGYGEWYASFNLAGHATGGDLLEVQWYEVFDILGGEMRVTVLLFDPNNAVLAQNHFVVRDQSAGWTGDLATSPFIKRKEPVAVPSGATRLQISLVSGGALSTTGTMIIDDLSVAKAPKPEVLPGNFWPNPTFEDGQDLDQPTGTPTGWNRGGNQPTIDQVSTANATSPTHALAVVDADAAGYGEWYADIPLAGRAAGGDILDLQWFELFNVAAGGEMRLTFLFFDAADKVVGEQHYVARGSSAGWNGALGSSTFTKRTAQLPVPAGAAKLRGALVSGGPAETTGVMLVDDLSVAVVPTNILEGNIWPNPTFENGVDLDAPTGTPESWNRGGSDAAIDQVTTAKAVSPTHALAVIDENAEGYGEWYADLDLTGKAAGGDALKLQWFELFNVANGEMRLTVLLFSADNTLLEQRHYVTAGSSEGWAGSVAASPFVRRTDRLTVPAGATRLQIALVSGGPLPTTGVMVIDDLSVAVLPRGEVLEGNFLPNPSFEEGALLDNPTASTPSAWNRGGNNASVDQISTANSVSPTHALALIDNDSNGYGEWYQFVALEGKAAPGDTLELQWFELFNLTGVSRVSLVFYGEGDATVGQNHFVVSSQSQGWAGTAAASPWVRRNEFVEVPEGAIRMLVTVASGGSFADTGIYLLDDLSIRKGSRPAPRVTALAPEGNGWRVVWSSWLNRLYTVEFSPTLRPPTFQAIPGAENLPSEGATTTYLDERPSAVSGYYRVVEQP